MDEETLDKLNESIQLFEESLLRHFIISAYVVVPELDDEQLAWKKVAGAWCLMLHSPSKNQAVSLLTTSIRKRVECSKVIPRLLQALMTARDEQVRNIEEATKAYTLAASGFI